MAQDLKDIIGSKVDSAILGFFLVAPVRSFTAKEISKRLGLSYATTAQTLGIFSRSGRLIVFSKHGKKYFLYNEKHTLLPEIRNFVLRNGLKYNDELFSAIKKLGDVKAAFLSGIFTGYPNLPVDLLLVGKINLKRLDEFLKATEKMMGLEINYSVMSVEEFLERRDTFDRFIKDIFDYRHLVVVDTLAKKKK